MGCAASSGTGAVTVPVPDTTTPAPPPPESSKRGVTFAEVGDESNDFSAERLAADEEELANAEWSDPTARYQQRPHATSLAFKPFRVDTSTASIAANDPSEDRIDTRDSAAETIVALFDGHGGQHASEFCKRNTLKLFDKARDEGLDVPAALAACIERSEAKFLDLAARAHKRGHSKPMLTGTCALIVHVDKLARSMNVLNVGDSRAVLAERDDSGILSALPLSFDHSARSDYERHRLASQFPGSKDLVREEFDPYSGTCHYSVHGLSMFTRSIGDFELKHQFACEFFNAAVSKERQIPVPDEATPWISHEPHIMFRQLHHRHEFVVQACDGLWDEMSSDTAVYLVGHFFDNHPSATGDEAAAFLLQRALMLVVNRLQIEEPELGVKTVDELMAMPPGKQGRRALHDDISVAVFRFVVAENEPKLPAKRPDRTDSMIVQGPTLRRGRRSDSFSTVTEEVAESLRASTEIDVGAGGSAGSALSPPSRAKLQARRQGEMAAMEQDGALLDMEVLAMASDGVSSDADDVGNHTGHTSAESPIPQHDFGIDAVNAATAAVEMERIMAEAATEVATG
eukprot:COSAG05_NODE_1313_length_5213_cov_6.108135_1_plen_572_part_00